MNTFDSDSILPSAALTETARCPPWRGRQPCASVVYHPFRRYLVFLNEEVGLLGVVVRQKNADDPYDKIDTAGLVTGLEDCLKLTEVSLSMLQPHKTGI